MNFDVYQGKTQKVIKATSGDLGVAAGVVKILCSTLPNGHDFKIFADNFFTSIPLIEQLKEEGKFFVGTIRLPRMKNCPLLCEKDLKKNGRGTIGYRVGQNRNIIAVRWLDNRAVTLVSSFVCIDPINEVRRYDRKTRTHVEVQQPNIVKVYNKFMGGVDKLNMLCALYKQTIRSRRGGMCTYGFTVLS